MSKLKAVDPKDTEPSKPKVLIYGKPGVGKTWASLDFPGVYYIDTEGGADLQHYTDKLKASGGVYFGPEQGSLDFEAVIGQIQALATEKHTYKTLVVDSISKLYNTSIADEAERLGDKDAFGASKKPAIAYMRRLVNWLNRLDMNVILIAHEKTEWGVDAKGQRAEIGSTFDAYDKLEYELHLCLNIVKAGPNRFAKVRKSRLTGFPEAESFKWSYNDFAAKYGQDVIEKDGKRLVLATPEQIAKIKNLINIVKLPEGQLEKWLKAANAETLEEIEQCKAQKIIDFINEKYIKTQGEAA
jgi:hypothetical protein